MALRWMTLKKGVGNRNGKALREVRVVRDVQTVISKTKNLPFVLPPNFSFRASVAATGTMVAKGAKSILNIVLKGAIYMKRRSPTIQQGILREFIAKLAKLPNRKGEPDVPASLSEMFRTKEYMTEIKAALKRGYSFDDLAKILSELCGFVITSRQMKYHFTRGKNRGLKSKSAKKSGVNRTDENRVPAADSQQKNTAEGAKETLTASDSEMKTSPHDSGFIFKNGAITVPEETQKSGAYSLNTKPEES
jgi:hypothetical protein